MMAAIVVPSARWMMRSAGKSCAVNMEISTGTMMSPPPTAATPGTAPDVVSQATASATDLQALERRLRAEIAERDRDAAQVAHHAAGDFERDRHRRFGDRYWVADRGGLRQVAIGLTPRQCELAH